MHAEGPSPHSVHLLGARTLVLLCRTLLAHDACTDDAGAAIGTCLCPAPCAKMVCFFPPTQDTCAHAPSQASLGPTDAGNASSVISAHSSAST